MSHKWDTDFASDRPEHARQQGAAPEVKPDEHGWRTIESAPTNQRRVLVFVPRFGPFTAHWDEKWHVAGLWHPAQPTHWQPIPPPPEPST